MNIEITDNSIKLMSKLKKLAKKHNCDIAFKIMNNNDTTINWDLIGKKTHIGDINDFVIEIYNAIYIYDDYHNIDMCLFTMYDRNIGSTNLLSYYNSITSFKYDNKQLCDISNKTKKWIDDNLIFDNIYTRSSNTVTICGFNNAQIDNNCTAYDDMLKCFANLVCDYLGEKRIK